MNKDEEYWEGRARKYDRLAANYLDKSLFRHEESFQRRAISRLIKNVEGKRILDAGCGTGDWCIYFADKGAVVSGVDISKTMIEIAKRETKKHKLKVDYEAVPLEKIAFPDKSFDIIISITTLQHITNPKRFRKAVKNLARVLKKNGIIALIEFSPPKRLKSWKDPRYMRYKTRGEWIGIFSKEGLKLVDEQPIFFIGFRVLTYLKKSFLSSKNDESTAETKLMKSKLRDIASLVQRIILFFSGLVDLLLSGMPVFKKKAYTSLFIFKK
ncbi:methyltransferase domain-containing protein [Candidatus Woesearchaeota archaeon]|nr:methyltransferase domain-containing protein [Candidatus Woesearchaeota archaeon]